MKTNNNTTPAFGTRLVIRDSQEGSFGRLSKKLLDGIILTGADITRNGINDELFLSINRSKPTSKNPRGVANALGLTWSSPDGKDTKQKNIWLKSFNKKTPVQIKKLLQEALAKFQPKEIRAKALKPEKVSSKLVLKHADLAVQISPERIQAAQEGRKVSKQGEKAFYLVSNYGIDDFTCA